MEEYNRTYNNVSEEKYQVKNLDWKIAKIRNYLFKEIEQNELMSEKRRRVCTTLN